MAHHANEKFQDHDQQSFFDNATFDLGDYRFMMMEGKGHNKTMMRLNDSKKNS